MSTDAYDYQIRGAESNCCGATILLPDICSECWEHCESIEEDEDGEETP